MWACWAAREEKPARVTISTGTPKRAATPSTGAPGRSQRSTTAVASRRPARMASRMASTFVPRPEAMSARRMRDPIRSLTADKICARPPAGRPWARQRTEFVPSQGTNPDRSDSAAIAGNAIDLIRSFTGKRMRIAEAVRGRHDHSPSRMTAASRRSTISPTRNAPGRRPGAHPPPRRRPRRPCRGPC